MACLHIAGVTCSECDKAFKDSTFHVPNPPALNYSASDYERGFAEGYGKGFQQGVEEGAKIKARTTDCDICGMLVRTDHSSPESYFVHEKGVWVHSRCKIEQEKNS